MRKSDYYDTEEGRAAVKRQFVEDQRRTPEEVSYFMFVPGRYYLAMWCVPMPPWAYLCHGFKGGCLSVLAWRKNEEPEHWHLRLCFRYFSKSREDAWDGLDKKNWKGFTFEGPEQMILNVVPKFFRNVGMEFNPKRDVLWIRGEGVEAFQKAVKEQRPPWLHLRVMKD